MWLIILVGLALSALMVGYLWSHWTNHLYTACGILWIDHSPIEKHHFTMLECLDLNFLMADCISRQFLIFKPTNHQHIWLWLNILTNFGQTSPAVSSALRLSEVPDLTAAEALLQHLDQVGGGPDDIDPSPFQVPPLEVLYHIKQKLGVYHGISPYIDLVNARYLQSRLLKWPLRISSTAMMVQAMIDPINASSLTRWILAPWQLRKSCRFAPAFTRHPAAVSWVLEDHFCDVLQSSDGAEHRAHAVLCAASKDFKNLLGGSFLEAGRVQRGQPVEIAVSQAAVHGLLDYVYGGQPEVNLESGLELLRLVEAFGLPKLANAIETGFGPCFFKQQFCPANFARSTWPSYFESCMWREGCGRFWDLQPAARLRKTWSWSAGRNFG